MNHRLTYSPQALGDLDHILGFLMEIHPDLPRKMRNLLAEKLEELDADPERWPPLNGIRAVRMALSQRLAYYCFYQFYEAEKRILILRIISQSADPKKWPRSN